MAEVKLRSDLGREITDLPPVCMACGAPATVRKSKTFSWQPPWVGILILLGLWPYVIVSMLMTKRQRVATPLCDKHSTYWWLYPTILLLGILAFIGAGIVGGVTMEGGGRGQGPNPISGLLCIASVMGFLILLVVAVVMNLMRIRPKEITDRYIHLTAVSQEFVDALDDEDEHMRRNFDREYDRGYDEPRRPPRSRPADDDDRYSDER
jgi:hypothetical protein